MPARTDLATDPEVIAGLAVVRLGTAFFRRSLDRLSDAELDDASLLPGWSRRHLLAHVGYNARAVARLVTWAATGEETPMYSSPAARAEEIEIGATLNAEALRNLVEHAAIDLDVRWRDLAADRWDFPVVTAQGRRVPVSETVWMRTREVWLHAVDLADGAQVEQVPESVLTRLVDDVHAAWAARSEDPVPVLSVPDADGGRTWRVPGREGPYVEGPLAAVAAWVTGRMPVAERERELRWKDAPPQPAPRWI